MTIMKAILFNIQVLQLSYNMYYAKLMKKACL